MIPVFFSIRPVPCAHIADYYDVMQQRRASIGSNILRHGYRQAATGIVTWWNNLFDL